MIHFGVYNVLSHPYCLVNIKQEIDSDKRCEQQNERSLYAFVTGCVPLNVHKDSLISTLSFIKC